MTTHNEPTAEAAGMMLAFAGAEDEGDLDMIAQALASMEPGELRRLLGGALRVGAILIHAEAQGEVHGVAERVAVLSSPVSQAL